MADKAAYKSKGMQGGIGGAVVLLFSIFGIVADGDVDIASVINQLIALVLVLYGAYGRYVARDKLTFKAK